jgi:hypothetical protein
MNLAMYIIYHLSRLFNCQFISILSLKQTSLFTTWRGPDFSMPPAPRINLKKAAARLRSFPLRRAFTFDQSQDPVQASHFKGFKRTIGPLYFQLIDARGGAKPEMQP